MGFIHNWWKKLIESEFVICIDNLLKSLGLKKINYDVSKSYDHAEYTFDSYTGKQDAIKEHKEFLKSLFEEENSRLNNIESKTSQLISQTSLVISLLSLAIPLLIDKSNDINYYVKIAIVSLVIFTYLFFFFSVFNALKNYNIKKFNYSIPAPKNVLDYKDKSIDEFNSEIVRDYLNAIDVNCKINNIKGTNLLHSYNCFKIATLLLSVLVVSVCTLLLFFSKSDTEIIEIKNPIKVSIEKPIKVEKSESEPIYIIKTDTIYIKR